MGLQSDAASTFSRILKRIVGLYSDAGAADHRLLLSFVASRRERRAFPVADQPVYIQYTCIHTHPCDFSNMELASTLDDSMEAEQGSKAQARL